MRKYTALMFTMMLDIHSRGKYTALMFTMMLDIYSRVSTLL